MGLRQRYISKSILEAIFLDQHADHQSILGRILIFFSFFHLSLQRYQALTFQKLRKESWKIDEEEYAESFRSAQKKGQLKPIGDLGYSGSTFFTTPNSKFLIKSIPRKFEHDFFRTVLLQPYTDHTTTHPVSLLVRITDLLYAPTPTLGALLGTAPSHHIIMENVLYGQETSSANGHEWETYDLKPADYFFPERDILDGRLASQNTKDKLIDVFRDRIRVRAQERGDLLDMVRADTLLLRSVGAVDYSLFLVRFPSSVSPPRLPSGTSEPWRTGLHSRDGKWVYRAVILDFFWAKNALQAKAMTALIKSYNAVDPKGPMSITTTPEEYQQRFMEMMDGIVVDGEEWEQGEEVHGQGSSSEAPPEQDEFDEGRGLLG